jgi:hypothetical protein
MQTRLALTCGARRIPLRHNAVSESRHRRIEERSMTETGRNDGLHPRHPGRGCSTSLIAAESPQGEPEVGGFFVFLPSGETKSIAWRQPRPIAPPLEAAKQFTANLVQSLLDANTDAARADLDATNWASVTAAVQRIILDWNDGVQMRINARMAQELRRSIAH